MVDGEGKRGVVLLLNDWSDRGKLKDLLKGGGGCFRNILLNDMKTIGIECDKD